MATRLAVVQADVGSIVDLSFRSKIVLGLPASLLAKLRPVSHFPNELRAVADASALPARQKQC